MPLWVESGIATMTGWARTSWLACFNNKTELPPTFWNAKSEVLTSSSPVLLSKLNKPETVWPWEKMMPWFQFCGTSRQQLKRNLHWMKSNWVKRKKVASSVWVNWIRRLYKVQVFDSCAVCVSEQGTKTQGPSSWCPRGMQRDWMTINWTRYRMCRIWPQRKDWNRHCTPASPGQGVGRGARKERANVNGWTVAILIIMKNESGGGDDKRG